MSKPKFTPELTAFLKTAYIDAVEEFGGASKVTAEFNKQFFLAMKRTEALGEFSDAQMRGSLMAADVYVATVPRQAPKKAGKTKAGVLAEVNTALAVKNLPELSAGMKLTLADLETLLEALSPVEGEG